MSKILVIGSINMDLVSKVENMPQVGETVLGKGFSQIPGGKGANQAVAMARLGADVSMIGKVGDDAFGRELKKGLEYDNINTEGVHIESGTSTGIAIITVDENANNSIIVNSGANFSVTKEFIDSNIDKIESADIVVLQLEIPEESVRHALEISKSLGKYTILNPAPAMPLSDEIIKNVDLLVPNETELELISKMSIKDENEVKMAANSLMRKGVREIIVTLGEKGCMHLGEGFCNKYDAIKVEAVDTTAAGDSFIAGVASSLAKGMKMDDAIGFATKVAAITVTREGAQSSLPHMDEKGL